VTLDRASVLLEDLCVANDIPVSHGFGHAARVLEHAQAAIEAHPFQLGQSRALAICLAALLHDADDGKYFSKNVDVPYANARQIAKVAGAPDEVVEDMALMISFVSTSNNGNSVPHQAVLEPELLWPRWADRLEAIGERGVVRCWQYHVEVDKPLFDSRTPLAECEEEVWAHICPSSLEAYGRKMLKSQTMLDHYYYVLLNVARPPQIALDNAYFKENFAKGTAPLLEICIELGVTGSIDVDRIQEMGKRLDADNHSSCSSVSTSQQTPACNL